VPLHTNDISILITGTFACVLLPTLVHVIRGSKAILIFLCSCIGMTPTLRLAVNCGTDFVYKCKFALSDPYIFAYVMLSSDSGSFSSWLVPFNLV
jgi:hypothetical protein